MMSTSSKLYCFFVFISFFLLVEGQNVFPKIFMPGFTRVDNSSYPLFVAPVGASVSTEQDGKTSISGSVTAILVHPSNDDIIYIGTGHNGVWRTDNANSENVVWKHLTPQYALPISALSFDNDPSYQSIIAVVGTRTGRDFPAIGILYSIDGGNSWTNVAGEHLHGNNLLGFGILGSTWIACSNSYNGDRPGGTFISNTKGNDWERVDYISCRQLESVDNIIIRNSISNGIERSDNGRDYKSINVGKNIAMFSVKKYGSDLAFYSAVINGKKVIIYKNSLDGGNSQVSTVDCKETVFSLVAGKDECFFACAAGDKYLENIIVSKCTSSSCVVFAKKFGINSMSLDFDNKGNLLEGDDAGIFRSTDASSGNVFLSLNGDSALCTEVSSFYSAADGFVINRDGMGVLYNGVSISNELGSVGKSNGGVVYLSNPISKEITFDNGKVNLINDEGVDIFNLKRNSEFFVVNNVNSGLLLFPLSIRNIYKVSTGNNEKLSKVDVDEIYEDAEIVSTVYGSKNDENNLYLATRNRLFVQKDVLKVLDNFPPRGIIWPEISSVYADPNDFDLVAVLFKYGEVAVSSNGGDTWSVLPILSSGSVSGSRDSVQGKILAIKSANEGVVLVGGRSGLFVFNSEVKRWWKVLGLPTSFVSDLKYNSSSDTVYFSLYGNGIWSISLASSVFQAKNFEGLPNKPPVVPNWIVLTYVFAAITVVLFLSSGVFAIGTMKSIHKKGDSDEECLLETGSEADYKA